MLAIPLFGALMAFGSTDAPPANPAIDAAAFTQFALVAAEERVARRLDEDSFIAALDDPDVIVLDARSADRYALLHVAGAVSLPFTDFTAERLAEVIPSPATRVVIYCNNNFSGDPRAFPTKVPAAALNLSTQVALRAYGYQDVWELAPQLDVTRTRIPLAGKDADGERASRQPASTQAASNH